MAAVAVLAGSVAILPGIYLGVMWAPITMIVLDGGRSSAKSDSHLVQRDGNFFESFELSSLLTQGARADIFAMFVVLGFLFGGVELFDSLLTGMTKGTSAGVFAAVVHLALKAAADTVSLCFMAALYFELDARAFIDGEGEQPNARLPAAPPDGKHAAAPSAWDDWSTGR